MRSPKYPLLPLVELREKRVQEQARELAKSVRARVKAERERCAAEDARAAHDSAAARVREDEARGLSLGNLRAADLARADAWEVRVRAERAALGARVDETRAGEARALEGEHRSRADLTSRKADAQVVAKDQARFGEGIRRQTEISEEEMASEAWRPKRA